jgi:hypothetical protein
VRNIHCHEKHTPEFDFDAQWRDSNTELFRIWPAVHRISALRSADYSYGVATMPYNVLCFPVRLQVSESTHVGQLKPN